MTGQEAYGAVAGEMFAEGEIGFQSPDEVLDSLDPAVVAAAETYALANQMKWPPIAVGLFITITGWA